MWSLFIRNLNNDLAELYKPRYGHPADDTKLKLSALWDWLTTSIIYIRVKVTLHFSMKTTPTHTHLKNTSDYGNFISYILQIKAQLIKCTYDIKVIDHV